MGIIYSRQNKYEEALENYNKSLEIMRKLGKENSLQTARTMNSIGAVYDDQSKYKEALEY